MYKIVYAQKAKIYMRRSPTSFLRAYRRESLYPSEEAEHPHLDMLQRSPQPSTQLNQIQIFCTYIEKTLNIWNSILIIYNIVVLLRSISLIFKNKLFLLYYINPNINSKRNCNYKILVWFTYLLFYLIASFGLNKNFLLIINYGLIDWFIFN